MQFLSGWFMNAPFELLRRTEVLDFIAYGFWCAATQSHNLHTALQTSLVCIIHMHQVLHLGPVMLSVTCQNGREVEPCLQPRLCSGSHCEHLPDHKLQPCPQAGIGTVRR